jgi:hypothetical protein
VPGPRLLDTNETGLVRLGEKSASGRTLDELENDAVEQMAVAIQEWEGGVGGFSGRLRPRLGMDL